MVQRTPTPSTSAGDTDTPGQLENHKTMVISNLEVKIQRPAPERIDPEFKEFGHYQIIKAIGYGGVGTVYEAIDQSLNRRVALKILNQKWLHDEIVKERFIREAKLCSMIRSNHVPVVHFVGEDNGIPFLAMELLQGFTLDDLMRTNHQLSMIQIIRLGREMAKGLAAAHAMKLIHRDIKPPNIWLEIMPDSSGGNRKMFRVKILDFGMARLVEQNQGLTRQGVIVGTPLYMSPEQATGGKIDSRSDLFSLGVVLYHLCTGKLPFGGRSVFEVLTNLTTEQAPLARDVNPKVPELLSNLINRLMQKKPGDRPAEAIDVANLLEIIEDDERKSKKPVEQPLPELAPVSATVPKLQARPLPAAQESKELVTEEIEVNPLRKWLIMALATIGVLLAIIVVLVMQLLKL